MARLSKHDVKQCYNHVTFEKISNDNPNPKGKYI